MQILDKEAPSCRYGSSVVSDRGNTWHVGRLARLRVKGSLATSIIELTISVLISHDMCYIHGFSV